MNLREEFSRIILHEAALATNIWDIPSVDEIYATATYLAEIAASSLVLRSYNNRYHLTWDKIAFESVGAHTNLMMALVDRMLGFYYGPDVNLPDSNFTYREIMEAIRLHDLPENIIGDIPDNGSGDIEEKRAQEECYYETFSHHYLKRETVFKQHVLRLLEEMNNQLTDLGKILYCADKVSATLITLQYDAIGIIPRLHDDDKSASARDCREMALCDEGVNGYHRASEMWTIDYLKERRLVDYDTTGYFTAILIMRTLQVRQHWYAWREKDYCI